MNQPKFAPQNLCQRLAEAFLLLLAGSVLYCWLEILYRGHTHWSMAICGGVCAFVIYRINERFYHWGEIPRALLGALVITVSEFVTGCLVNLWLGLGVWDYSHLPLNLWGQICPSFCAIWFLLCFPVGWLCGVVRRSVFLHES